MSRLRESPKSSFKSAIPFGIQTIKNVVVSGKTVSFIVDTNGQRVDDISVLALDESPDMNENLFMSTINDVQINHGDQSFSKTFNFNQSIDKYLIIVRSVSGLITSTNFNV